MSRAIEIGAGLREQLVTLRLLGEDEGPTTLDASRVADVEAALDCALHPELLALLAAAPDDLDDFELDLATIGDHTAAARARGCGEDFIAVGRHPDGLAYLCVERRPDLEARLRWYDFDQLDRQMRAELLTDWLDERIESRREFLADGDDDELARSEIEPGPDDLAAFEPALV